MAWFHAGLALAVILVAAPAAANSNLVQNGDFSSYTNNNGGSASVGFKVDYNGTLNHWSSGGTPQAAYYNFLFIGGTAQHTAAEAGAIGQYGNVGLWDNNTAGNGWDGNGPPGVGGNFMALDGDFQTGPLTQTISGLTVGRTYAVTFRYAFAQQSGFAGPTLQDLTVGLGGQAQSVPVYNLPSHGFSGWSQATYYFQADNTSDVLSFLASANIQLPPFALLSDISMIDVPEPAAWSVLGVGLAGLIGAARLRRAKAAVATGG